MNTREIEYESHAAVELISERSRLVVVHDVGPRIAAFGHVDRDSLLFWDRAKSRRRGDWYLRGGHRLWIARPGADESEETYEPDNAACTWRIVDGTFEVTGAVTSSRLEKSMRIRAEASTWIIEHCIRNAGTMLWSGAAWALTCTRPDAGTRYRIPFGAVSPGWDAVTMVMPRAWGGEHTSRLHDPQLVMTDAALEIHATGEEAKRLLRTTPGALEMTAPDRGSFSITAPFDSTARYPLDCNLAVYLGTDAFMVELESMSALRTLAPGQSLSHVETWTLA